MDSSFVTHHTGWWIMHMLKIIDSSILKEMFSSVSKCLSSNGEKQSWDKIKKKWVPIVSLATCIIC